jgi:hypothetical protein
LEGLKDFFEFNGIHAQFYGSQPSVMPVSEGRLSSFCDKAGKIPDKPE